MTNLEKMLANQQQQQNLKGGHPEHHSSHMISKTAPFPYKSHKHNNRNTTNQHKDHQFGQIQTTNRLEHDLESTNLTHHKQKSKHFKSQKTHPQDQNEFKKRKVNFSKNTNNNKKRKVPPQHHEETSGSHSLTSQSTTSDLSTHPWNNRLHKKQPQKSRNNHDVRHKEQNALRKTNRIIHLQHHRLLHTSKTYGYISDPKKTI
jgi:hypothetical protein